MSLRYRLHNHIEEQREPSIAKTTTETPATSKQKPWFKALNGLSMSTVAPFSHTNYNARHLTYIPPSDDLAPSTDISRITSTPTPPCHRNHPNNSIRPSRAQNRYTLAHDPPHLELSTTDRIHCTIPHLVCHRPDKHP